MTLCPRNFYHSQVLVACIATYTCLSSYGLFLDYDDYFNLVLPNQANIHYYLSKFFSKSNIGSVCMKWREMGCKPIESRVKDEIHGNLTSALSGFKLRWRSEKKCVHRLNATLLFAVHNVIKMLPTYHRSFTDGHLAYVAHNRYNNKLCNNSS